GNETYKAAEPVAIVLKIVKVNQSITFGPIAAKMIGASPFDLSATSSSGLSIVYSTTSDKVTIQSSKVILNKPGRATIKAEQTGNAKYNAAAPVEQSFCINPLKPIISTTANVAPSLPRTFGSSSESGNQWFKDGQPIAGATNVNYTATEDGKYSVQVTVDDCQTMSDNIVFTISGVNEIVDAAVLVYPNPAMDEAIVRVDGELSSEVIIELYDVLGRQIDTRNSVARRDERFDVSKLGTGVFLFKIIIDDRIVIRRMIRN
ncbi:MAG TPA: T9SS type A sorting domain-containing protein, partial [Cyclobacteriaceae bacterium]|nr:T9SS type A sorting domain-containing protein [Cyclobacteriaceae bacterium]